jgi:phospholipid/cholesterol/gamma-HCH transport system substrate-binding protein
VKFRSAAVKLFIFAAFTGAVTIMLASVIGNFSPFRSRYSVAAVFDDVTGLLKADPVTLAGVTIGKVKGAKVEKGLAVVELSIDSGVKLPRTTTVEVRYRNLIGLRVVNLDPGDGRPPYLEENERIPLEQTQGPLDLDKVFNNLKPLLTGFNASDLNTLSKALVVSFANHKDDIDAVLGDTATFFGALSGKGAELGSLISNVATVATAAAGEREQLQRLLASLATVSGSLAGNSGELDRVLTNLDTVTRDLGRLIKNNRASLEQDIDDLAEVLQIVLEHRVDLTQILNHLDDQLRATLRAMSYGEWGNLYVYALCVRELSPTCDNGSSAGPSQISEERGIDTLFAGTTRGVR